MNRIINEIYNEIQRNCYTHLVSTIIALILGIVFLGIGYILVSSVIISGHDYRVSEIFRNVEVSSRTLISKPIEVGVSGGIFSIAFKIESNDDEEQIIIEYQLSFDKKTWFNNLNTTDNIIIQNTAETSNWYIERLSPEPSAYIRFIVTFDRDNLSCESLVFDMKVFEHM
jgi:hypothetical protein